MLNSKVLSCFSGVIMSIRSFCLLQDNSCIPIMVSKEELFIFSAIRLQLRRVPWWVPLEQKVVKDVDSIQALTSTISTQIEPS